MTPPAALVRSVSKMTENNDHTPARIAIASWCSSAVDGNKPNKAYFWAIHDALAGIRLVEIWLTGSTQDLCELREALTDKMFKKMKEVGLADAARIFNKAL